MPSFGPDRITTAVSPRGETHFHCPGTQDGCDVEQASNRRRSVEAVVTCALPDRWTHLLSGPARPFLPPVYLPTTRMENEPGTICPRPRRSPAGGDVGGGVNSAPISKI